MFAICNVITTNNYDLNQRGSNSTWKNLEEQLTYGSCSPETGNTSFKLDD